MPAETTPMDRPAVDRDGPADYDLVITCEHGVTAFLRSIATCFTANRDRWNPTAATIPAR